MCAPASSQRLAAKARRILSGRFLMPARSKATDQTWLWKDVTESRPPPSRPSTFGFSRKRSRHGGRLRTTQSTVPLGPGLLGPNLVHLDRLIVRDGNSFTIGDGAAFGPWHRIRQPLLGSSNQLIARHRLVWLVHPHESYETTRQTHPNCPPIAAQCHDLVTAGGHRLCVGVRCGVRWLRLRPT